MADVFATAGLAGARWFVGSQLRMSKPYWDANHGRFMYNRHLASGKTVLGINWTQGRGIFCLLAGWELTRDAKLLETALIAADYIKSLQIYDCPDDPVRQYAIREQVPASWFVYPRDASEAAMALVFLYRATGQEEFLRRAEDYYRWFMANAWKPRRWPATTVFLESGKLETSLGAYQVGNGGLFYHLWRATGDKKYLQPLRRLADAGIARFVRPDGAIGEKESLTQHALADGAVLNDDGFMVFILSAYLATGNEKYLDVCRRHATWILENVKPPLPVLSALPCMCTFMIEYAAVTDENQCRAWAETMLRKFILPLQVKKRSDPLVHGAFRGEDEPVEYYGNQTRSAKKTDFVTTRTTAYATLACLKLAGVVGPYYGALGWERKLPRVSWPVLGPHTAT